MVRKAGYALVAAGIGLIAWIGVTVWWGDPFTALYTRHEQRVLSGQLDRLDRRWAARIASSAAVRRVEASLAAQRAATRNSAAAFRRSLREGQPIGRIIVPRLGLNMVVVQGTSERDLEKGPGHYDAASGANTSLPGLGGVVAIAGHRTTYLHPFRHIDDLRPGDRISLRMPYGTFQYTVYYHRIVDATDWSILRSRRFEKLVLSACHPLYSATHRWVVFARLQVAASAGPA
jgi:sortase A